MTARLAMLFLLFVLGAEALPADAASLLSSPRQAIAEGEVGDAEREESDDGWRGPVANRNQFPPAFLFLSLEPERARALKKGEGAVLVNFDYSNILVLQQTDSETLEIDLESLRALLQGRLGLGRDFEIAASAPVYWMHGGFLDPFISGFHHAFGLPNRVRDIEPENVFRYEWRADGTPILGAEKGFTALGDVTVQVKRAITWNQLGPTELAARTAIKLPTGSRDNLAGSGGTDVGFGVALSRVGRRVGGFFNVSYHITSDLDEVRSENFFSWMAAVDWRFKPNLVAILQYDEFRPMLESNIGVLEQSGRQIVLGLRWRQSERIHFEWRFVEDLSTTSPDFTLGFQIAHHWKPDGPDD